MTVSMIAKPGGLTTAHLAEVPGPVTWLSDGEAALVEGVLPAGVREALGPEGVDVNALPGGPRARRLLLADMDSTMIQQECIDEMAAHFGIGDAVAEITARAMDGQLDFEAALNARVALLEGLPLAALETVFEERIRFTPGGATLLATMKARGAYAALVSGGFTYFTGRVAAALGFDESRANVLLHADGALTGAVAKPVLGQEAKVTALEEITARRGLTPDDVLAVGDGANDLAMLGRAGLGVALHAKPSVQAQCDVRVNHGDLTALLFLQGIPRAAFITP
ncbi:MAG: phosphoserine phosphatase SerB [Pseudomonadota bacterium]